MKKYKDFADRSSTYSQNKTSVNILQPEKMDHSPKQRS